MADLDIRELVRRLADRDNRGAEANVTADVQTLLLYGDLNLDGAEVRLETTAGGRERVDVEIGLTVIEAKRDLRVGNVLGDAETQLAGYLKQREELLGARYVGVITDGADWKLYIRRSGKLAKIADHHVDAEAPQAAPLLAWLEGVLATRDEVPPTPREIRQRLGAGSSAHRLEKETLTTLFMEFGDLPEVQLKKELWGRLLSTAYGTKFVAKDELFVEHTYLVLTAELIAHAVIGWDLASPSVDPSDLLEGGLFVESQVGGVVEHDFFDWVLAKPSGERFVRALARRLARFDWGNVNHDVLKILYESVIDAETRHDLGEYYTPDFLAQRIVEETVPNPLETRVMDPACGSGTFLFYAVRRYLDAGEEAGHPLADLIRGVTAAVIGVDIHPVAVTFSRVTYLLAIGTDRIRMLDRPPFSVPVYLGDSVQWEERNDLLTAEGALVVRTSQFAEDYAQTLEFPADVVDHVGRFDRLVADMSDRATNRDVGDPHPDIQGLLDHHEVHDSARSTLVVTFDAMCHLHDEERNHVWGYYVRNLARPKWLSKPENRVDAIVGNPPWLAYRYMPEEMQSRFREMSSDRQLWAGAQLANVQDLSGLFLVRCVELYLRPGGRFGFVMPGAALSGGAYEALRDGHYPAPHQAIDIDFGTPWDMDAVRTRDPDRQHLFPVPSAVLFGSHTPQEPKPLGDEVTLWSGTIEGRNASLDEVRDDLVTRRGTRADSGNADLSPYRSRFNNGATIYPRVLTIVTQEASGPLGAGAGRVKVRSSRSNFENSPWKDLTSLSGTVEGKHIFPLLLGQTVTPFRALPHQAMVAPLDRNGKVMANLDRSPGLQQWWGQASQLWEANRTEQSKLSLLENIDYQNKLTRQFPIPEHRVAYTLSGSRLAAVRLTGTSDVIDQSLVWAPAESLEEALYLEALFNSDELTRRVRPLQPRGQFGPRHFTKHVFALPIPLFDSRESSHIRAADLAKECESLAAGVELESDVWFQTARRRVRAALSEAGLLEALDKAVAEILTAGARSLSRD